LLIVSIIGIIGPISYVGVSSYFTQARDYHRKKDLKDLEVVMEYYYDAASAYPPSIPDCGEPLMYNNKVILDSFPCDQKTNEPYMYITDELTQYQWYKIYTHLERDADQSIPIIGCTEGCGPDCAYNFGVASSNISVTACILPEGYVTPIPTQEPTAPSTPTQEPTQGLLPEPTSEPTMQYGPTSTPTESIPLPTPSLGNLKYVCAPGGGQPGSCEPFDDPDRSLCPFVYLDDPTCQYQCGIKDNKCKNSSGKHKPY
jgi:hypothetical protein